LLPLQPLTMRSGRNDCLELAVDLDLPPSLGSLCPQGLHCMYIVSSPPSRWTFYYSVLMGYILSALMILNPETDDGLLFAYWLLSGFVIYNVFGMFILYGGAARDSVFGLTACPRCGKKGWDIKQKLKISNKKDFNLGRCNFCKKKGSILPRYSLPFILTNLLFVPILGITGSISIASFVTIVLIIGYVICFGRYAPIHR